MVCVNVACPFHNSLGIHFYPTPLPAKNRFLVPVENNNETLKEQKEIEKQPDIIKFADVDAVINEIYSDGLVGKVWSYEQIQTLRTRLLSLYKAPITPTVNENKILSLEEMVRIRKESDEYCAPCGKDDDCTDQCKLIQEIDRLELENSALKRKLNSHIRCEKCGLHLENSEFKPLETPWYGECCPYNCGGCGLSTENCVCQPVSQEESDKIYKEAVERWEKRHGKY